MRSMTWADRVRDIRADPDSDGPRLVAADWLLERGYIRGENVVLSCQLAHLTAGTPEHAALERRRRELEGLHSARWLDRIFQLGAQGARLDESPLLKRGFVEAVTLVGEYAASFEAICEHEPIIDLTLVDCGPSNYQQVAAMPALALIRDLRLEGVHIRGCEAVLASPHLTGAERVSLPSQDPALLVALSAGPHRLDSCKLREDLPSLRKLVAADFFARTSNLDISGLTDRGAAVLAEAVIPRAGSCVTVAARDRDGRGTRRARPSRT